MKLYYAPGASSLAAHICLREADRRFDLERVDLRTRRTASGGDYLQINPRGTVPALQLDGGSGDVLFEVPAVLQYIADLAPDRGLAPPAGTFARYHLQSWLAFVSAELDQQLGPLFEEAPAAWQARQRGKIGERLLYLEDVLADRAFLMGERFMVCDAYLFVMLQRAREQRVDVQLYPTLAGYDDRITRRPTVRDALAAEGLRSRHPWKLSA